MVGLLGLEKYLKIMENEKLGLASLVHANNELIKEISDVIANEDTKGLDSVLTKINKEKEEFGVIQNLKKIGNALSKNKNQVNYFQNYKSDIENKLENFKLYKIKDNFVLENEDKHIKIIDSGNSVSCNDDCEDFEEQVAIMIEIAKSKGWDLATIEIDSKDDNFIKEANKQLGRDLLKEKDTDNKKDKKTNTQKQRLRA